MENKTKNKTKVKVKVVYRMDIALKLQEMGHRLLYTFPNPQKVRYICFAFEVDNSLYEDLDCLVKETKKYGRE